MYSLTNILITHFETFRTKLKEAVIKYGTIEEAKMLNMHDCPGPQCCMDYGQAAARSRSPTPQRPAGVKKTVYDAKLGRVVTVGGEDSDVPETKLKTDPDAEEAPQPGKHTITQRCKFDYYKVQLLASCNLLARPHSLSVPITYHVGHR